MGVTFLDPRAEPGAPVEPYELGIDVEATPVTIGLLASGFPDSVAFLDAVADALADRLDQVTFRRYDKGDASIVAPPDMLSDIEAHCGAVIAAYGH
jgi:hypothetical protein